MLVKDLKAILAGFPPDAKVYFDTEAQCFDVHLVPVDKVYLLDGDNMPGGEPVVTLHEDAPHRSGHRG
jgi:hypothetical protein